MSSAGLRPMRRLCLNGSIRPRQSLRALPCRSWTVCDGRWSSSSTVNPEKSLDKTYYITTPIFYVNAAPHIGHLYTMILSDVLKRWQQLQGKQAFLSTGTDEHGMKIQQAALREQVEPQQLCDDNAAKFKKLTEAGCISHDTFIRTTMPEHKAAVKAFYKELKNRLPKDVGLYKGTHEGWYSVSDECFHPEELVEASIEPQTGERITVSIETGSKVEWVKDDTWFFPLTKYKDALLKFYDENPDWVQPAHKMNEVKYWVMNHLEDLSVTRPASRLTWGIQDPDDSRHTIYVWVDALINYLTITGYGPEWMYKNEDMGMWPADLHVVGKDILRFHAVYWPALLLALGLPLPKKILCHNHWTMSNRKMSKSVGNVVNPFFAVERYGVEPLRYFLMRNSSLNRDMDYSNDTIEVIYTKELMASVGNMLYRITRPKASPRWSVREAVQNYVDGVYKREAHLNDPNVPMRDLTSMDSIIDSTIESYKKAMDSLDVSEALGAVFNLMQETNRYMTNQQPWVSVKDQDRESQIIAIWTIYNCAEALRISAILLKPVMPTKSDMILDELEVREDRRILKWASRGADDDYGMSKDNPKTIERLEKWKAVFPPLPAAESKEAREGKHRKTGKVKTGGPAQFSKTKPQDLRRMEKKLKERAGLSNLEEEAARATGENKGQP